SPSTCCRRSRRTTGAAWPTTKPRGGSCNAGAPSRRWRATLASTKPPSRGELGREIGHFLQTLKLANASPHTLRNYASDLNKFLDNPPRRGSTPPALRKIDHLHIREFLGALYTRRNANRSVARKLAALRAFFRFLAREGKLASNPAKLVATPKTPKLLPPVM